MGIAASQPAEPSTENRAFVFIKVRPVACSHAAACSHKLSCGCAAARSHGGGAGACVEHAHKGWLQHPGRGPDCAPRSIQPFSAADAAPDPFSAAHEAPDPAQTAPDLPSLPPAQDATIIDEKKLIDQHYYPIASKATILKPAELNVPAAKFKEKFGLEWSEALSKSLVFNAMDACKKLGVDAAQMASMWNQAKDAGQLIKFGGGFYCGKLTTGQGDLYVFNGFFMSMRAKFVEPGARPRTEPLSPGRCVGEPRHRAAGARLPTPPVPRRRRRLGHLLLRGVVGRGQDLVGGLPRQGARPDRP